MSDTDAWNWSSNQSDNPAQSDKAADLSFKLDCKCLHVDHTAALHHAIDVALPWLRQEPLAGLHLVHVAGSQNGWWRPENPRALLYLSRRTRLTLRVPLDSIGEAHALAGRTLDIAGNSMRIGKATKKPVMAGNVLLARHVIAHDDSDENEFLRAVAAQMEALGIQFKKLLPGRQLKLNGPNGVVNTRSLLVADIKPADSLTLQELGLGEGRTYGCGLFIHHKGIKAVNSDE